MKTAKEQVEEIRKMYRAEGREIEEIYRTKSTPNGQNIDGKIADVELNFPTSGIASTYADKFEGKSTSNGETYSHDGYTAALIPKSRWYALPMKTRLQLTYGEQKVIVNVNDRGGGKFINGKADEGRVLDLSRAAMAYLMGVPVSSITDSNAGIIDLKDIKIVPRSATLGPVQP